MRTEHIRERWQTSLFLVLNCIKAMGLVAGRNESVQKGRGRLGERNQISVSLTAFLYERWDNQGVSEWPAQTQNIVRARGVGGGRWGDWIQHKIKSSPIDVYSTGNTITLWKCSSWIWMPSYLKFTEDLDSGAGLNWIVRRANGVPLSYSYSTLLSPQKIHSKFPWIQIFPLSYSTQLLFLSYTMVAQIKSSNISCVNVSNCFMHIATTPLPSA